MTSPTSSEPSGGRRGRDRHVHDRRRRDPPCPRARWSSGPPSCSASRSRASATTRCSTRSVPAGSASSRSRASASRSPSCTTTVTDGMVVKTQLTSPVAEKAQRGNLELLLLNHPLDCPMCDKGGECPLQNQTLTNGSERVALPRPKRTFEKPIAISCQVLLDRERCVLCARCTRFSQQIAGDPFIELFERGALEQVAIYTDEPFDSYFSGNTVQICPVGALTGAQYRFRARPFDLVSTPSVCEHCSSGCQQRTDWRRGKVMRRLAGDDPAVNEEWNCDKGRWAFSTPPPRTGSATPLVRDDDGYLVEASWSDALARAADGLAAAVAGSASSPVAGSPSRTPTPTPSSPGSSLGTNDVDFRARPHSVEEQDFLAARVAGRYLEATYADLEARTRRAARRASSRRRSRRSSSCGCARRCRRARSACSRIAPFATAGLRKLGGRLLRSAPGTEPEIARRVGGGRRPARRRRRGRRRGAAPSRARSSSSASGSPPSPALSARRRLAAGPAPGWPGCHAGPATAVRSRRAASPGCCPAAARSPTPRHVRRSRRLGRRAPGRTGPGRRRDPARGRGRRACARRRRRRPGRPPRPAARPRRDRQRPVPRQPRAPRLRGHRPGRRGPPGRAGGREGRHLPGLGGARAPVRRDPRGDRRPVRRPGARLARRRDGVRPG